MRTAKLSAFEQSSDILQNNLVADGRNLQLFHVKLNETGQIFFLGYSLLQELLVGIAENQVDVVSLCSLLDVVGSQVGFDIVLDIPEIDLLALFDAEIVGAGEFHLLLLNFRESANNI